MKEKLNTGESENAGIIQSGAEVLKRYENEISELRRKLAQYVCLFGLTFF